MTSNLKPPPDQVLVDIADYVCNFRSFSEPAISSAGLCLTDTLAGALDALDFSACTRLLGPSVEGTIVPNGARVPGTSYVLDPENAAFNLACLIRWLDYNDTFNAATGSHPSDNLAGILMLADYLSRQRISSGQQPLTIRDVLENLIKAYEIQGCLAIENGFGETAAMDHNILPRVASSAVLTGMLGGTHEQIVNAISNAFIDSSLSAFRHAPNTGARKSWSCAEAIFQAMRLARMAIKGEMGYPSVLTAEYYGFYDARFKGRPFTFQRPYGEYIIQHSNFKFVAAGMHGQTAVECALRLHRDVRDRLDDIDRIEIRSHRALMRIMNKSGPLYNPADRDHCVQYTVAVGLIQGALNARDYEDDFAADPRIDRLRAKMTVVEDEGYTRSFFDPDKRTNATAIQIWLKDGSSTSKVEIEYPAGHYKRRADFLPVLRKKLEASLARRFSSARQDRVLRLCRDASHLDRTPVNEFLDLLVVER